VSNTIIVDDWDKVEKYVFENRHSFAGISFLPPTGDKDYNQAPNTAVISAKEMVKKYDTAAIFASGLVVDGLDAFPNLWQACATAQGMGDDLSLETSDNAMKKDWVRRFNSFAENYLGGDVKQAEYCLKDSYLLHKWNKINKNFNTITWEDDLTEKKYTEVDTLGAAACAGGECEIDF
jgi:ribonucleoside-diphosphate reductase alpha chain